MPAEATQSEAVAAASLGSNSIINNSGNYQPVNTKPRIFGEQLFRGVVSTTSGSTFNDSYVINPGDNVQVRMWGAYQYAATTTVDPQGNIFLPNVGSVKVVGVQNGNLQNVVQTAIGRIYRSNVGVYASLENAQPVKVFVTGFVKQPGYYGGLAADSVLSYLDGAGGVDPKRGSYIDIQVRRGGQLVQQINLYEFLIAGRLVPFVFLDGDVIHIPLKTSVITVNGQVRTQGALTYDAHLTVGDCIAKSGGFDDNADSEQILVMHQNGESSVVNTAYRIQEGGEIMVLPKVKTRRLEIARGLSQIIYQLAVATGVIVGL
ncbi:Polysialic acid transport protein kpsD precursor [Moraxella ovis]|nr:Polysialic acid transport protein kpsD precursor [Moraxella ovis]STZ06215.1 Polysialic acid transport protein kpsD precursor [Moraxella ovis]